MPTDTLCPDKNLNGKKFYLLPIHETIRLETQFKADGVLIFQSAGLNMDSCISRNTEGVEERKFNNKRRKLVVYPKRWRKKGKNEFGYQSKEQEGLSADSVGERVNERATCGMSKLLNTNILDSRPVCSQALRNVYYDRKLCKQYLT